MVVITSADAEGTMGAEAASEPVTPPRTPEYVSDSEDDGALSPSPTPAGGGSKRPVAVEDEQRGPKRLVIHMRSRKTTPVEEECDDDEEPMHYSDSDGDEENPRAAEETRKAERADTPTEEEQPDISQRVRNHLRRKAREASYMTVIDTQAIDEENLDATDDEAEESFWQTVEDDDKAEAGYYMTGQWTLRKWGPYDFAPSPRMAHRRYSRFLKKAMVEVAAKAETKAVLEAVNRGKPADYEEWKRREQALDYKLNDIKFARVAHGALEDWPELCDDPALNEWCKASKTVEQAIRANVDGVYFPEMQETMSVVDPRLLDQTH